MQRFYSTPSKLIAAATVLAVLWYVAVHETVPAANALGDGDYSSPQPADSDPAWDVRSDATGQETRASLTAARDATRAEASSPATLGSSSEPLSEFAKPSGAHLGPPPASEIDAHYARQLELLNDAIDRGRQGTWAAATQPTLAATLRAAIEGASEFARLEDVKCTETLCRARVTTVSSEDPAALVANVRVVAWSGERFFSYAPGDPPRLSMFAARDGVELPRAAPPRALAP